MELAAGGGSRVLHILMPALHRAGVELAFWHETSEPDSRTPIDTPPGTLSLCASTGLQRSIDRLREWKPDVIYVQGLYNLAGETALLNIAPAVFFLHTYTGTCISGRNVGGPDTPRAIGHLAAPVSRSTFPDAAGVAARSLCGSSSRCSLNACACSDAIA